MSQTLQQPTIPCRAVPYRRLRFFLPTHSFFFFFFFSLDLTSFPISHLLLLLLLFHLVPLLIPSSPPLAIGRLSVLTEWTRKRRGPGQEHAAQGQTERNPNQDRNNNKWRGMGSYTHPAPRSIRRRKRCWWVGEKRKEGEGEREIGVGEEARPGALRGGVSTYFVEWGTGAELAAAPAERCSN